MDLTFFPAHDVRDTRALDKGCNEQQDNDAEDSDTSVAAAPAKAKPPKRV
jgi:hypothetical protein